MAACLLEAPEGHALAVDDAVGQRLGQALLVLLPGRAPSGPPAPRERSRQGVPITVVPKGDWRGPETSPPSLPGGVPQPCPGAQRHQVPIPGHPPSSSSSPPLPPPRCHHRTRRVPRPPARPARPPAARSSSPSAGSCASAPAGVERGGPWGAELRGAQHHPLGVRERCQQHSGEARGGFPLPLTSGDGSWVGTRPSMVAVRSCSPRMSRSCWASTSCCSMLQWFSRDRITGYGEVWGARCHQHCPKQQQRGGTGGKQPPPSPLATPQPLQGPTWKAYLPRVLTTSLKGILEVKVWPWYTMGSPLGPSQQSTSRQRQPRFRALRVGNQPGTKPTPCPPSAGGVPPPGPGDEGGWQNIPAAPCPGAALSPRSFSSCCIFPPWSCPGHGAGGPRDFGEGAARYLM